MAVMTVQSLLESVETAIVTVLTSGQSYRIGDRQYTRADLAELQKMRTSLKAQYDTESMSSSGFANKVKFERAV